MAAAADVRRLVGDAAWAALVGCRGGTTIYIPHAPTRLLIERLGGDRAAATRLCAVHRGCQLQVPMHRRDRRAQVLAMRAAGMSVRETAQALAVSVRYVYKLSQMVLPVVAQD